MGNGLKSEGTAKGAETGTTFEWGLVFADNALIFYIWRECAAIRTMNSYAAQQRLVCIELLGGDSSNVMIENEAEAALHQDKHCKRYLCKLQAHVP